MTRIINVLILFFQYFTIAFAILHQYYAKHPWGKNVKNCSTSSEPRKIILNVKDSNPLNPNDAMLAVDGNYGIEYEKITQEFQCLQFNSNNNNSIWEIDLGKQYVVEKVIIYTLDEDKNIYDEFSIRVVVHNISCFEDFTIPEELFNISCVKNEASVQQKIEFKCLKSHQGRYTSIHLLPKCRNSAGCNETNIPLNMCEIEIWGYEVTDLLEDVANFKPTSQSSISYGGKSNLAVDGVYSTKYTLRGKPACTHTTETVGYHSDPYPWWRVDLLRNHYITKMNIYNRGEALYDRLHDIVVRIGDKDILSIKIMKVIFEENMICKNFVGRYLPAGDNIFDCDTPLIGQFVSIQIVERCAHAGPNYNFLTLCEVDVYGFPIKNKPMENVALNKLLLYSPSVEEMNEENHNPYSLSINSKVVDIPEMERALVLPWWKIDLEVLHAVNSITLWFRNTDKKIPSQAIVIRVGSDDINDFNKGKYFTENPVCAREVLNIKGSGKKAFQCVQLMTGRYVSVQLIEMCNDKYCTVNFLPIIQMEILGYKIEKYYNVTNVAVGKNTRSSYNNKFSNLTNDGKISKELYIHKSTVQCSKITGEFPWWRVYFVSAVKIDTITIYNVKGNQSQLMHDIEIRVGNSDIARMRMNRRMNVIFRENHLCVGLYNQSIPEGANTFNCSSPTFGRYLSIQIVKSCNAETCGPRNQNILFLCELEITGECENHVMADGQDPHRWLRIDLLRNRMNEYSQQRRNAS